MGLVVWRVAVLSVGWLEWLGLVWVLLVPGFLGFRSFVDGLYLVLLVFGFAGVFGGYYEGTV